MFSFSHIDENITEVVTLEKECYVIDFALQKQNFNTLHSAKFSIRRNQKLLIDMLLKTTWRTRRSNHAHQISQPSIVSLSSEKELRIRMLTFQHFPDSVKAGKTEKSHDLADTNDKNFQMNKLNSSEIENDFFSQREPEKVRVGEQARQDRAKIMPHNMYEITYKNCRRTSKLDSRLHNPRQIDSPVTYRIRNQINVHIVMAHKEHY